MATLVLFNEKAREYIVIDDEDLDDEEFEERYAAVPVLRVPVDADFIELTPWPTGVPLTISGTGG